jgi:hypothetical protein
MFGKNKIHTSTKVLALICLVDIACGTGCQKSGSTAAGSGSATTAFQRASTLCQPLAGGYTSIFADETSGLQGRLYAMAPQNFGVYNHVQDYITYGIDTGTDVFLSDLNVPTRQFSEGFPTASGNLLMFNGGVLVEWFAMHLESEIQLSSSDAPGQYQFAVLADDGAIFSIKAPGNDSFVQYINDDGTHPTTMACSQTPLTIGSYDTIPMTMDYYQGPRYEIALQLLWRPLPLDGNIQDPLCGTSGNEQFFNDTHIPSTPQQNYLDLESRGWKPLGPANFVIPGGVINPCTIPGFVADE